MAFRNTLMLGMKLLFNRRVTPGVPAIIKNSRGEVLLGKRKNNLLMYPGFWGLPGGLIEYGETVEDAIKRELREELGVDSRVIKYGKPVMDMPTKKFPVQDLSIPVYCEISGIPKPLDETTEVKWFKPSEIKEIKLAYSHKKILEQEGILK